MKVPHSNKRHTSFLFTETKLRVGKLTGAGSAFSHFFETALPPGIVVGGEVKNIDALAQLLLSIKKQAKLKDREVVIGIPEAKATTHSMVLPPLSPSEVQQAILRDAESFLPFATSEQYIDWMLVEKLPDNKQKILLSAVPKSVIDGFASAFGLAGFSPVAFETTALTLYNLVPKTERDNTLILKIGTHNSILILVYEGTIAASSVMPDNENLLDKLKRLIEFYLDKKTGGNLPNIMYMCGLNATAQTATQITASLGIKAQLLKANLPQLPEQKQVEYAALYSLANKNVAETDDIHSINVMPSELILKYKENKHVKFEKMLKFLFTIALMAFAFITYQSYQTVLQASRTITRRTVSSSAPEEAQSLSFSPAKVALLEKIANGNNELTAAVDTVYKSASEGVTVSGISYEQEKNEFIITGISQTRQNLLDYKDALEKTTSFNTVTIPFSSLEQDFDVDFRIILTFIVKKG